MASRGPLPQILPWQAEDELLPQPLTALSALVCSSDSPQLALATPRSSVPAYQGAFQGQWPSARLAPVL